MEPEQAGERRQRPAADGRHLCLDEADHQLEEALLSAARSSREIVRSRGCSAPGSLRPSSDTPRTGVVLRPVGTRAVSDTLSMIGSPIVTATSSAMTPSGVPRTTGSELGAWFSAWPPGTAGRGP